MSRLRRQRARVEHWQAGQLQLRVLADHPCAGCEHACSRASLMRLFGLRQSLSVPYPTAIAAGSLVELEVNDRALARLQRQFFGGLLLMLLVGLSVGHAIGAQAEAWQRDLFSFGLGAIGIAVFAVLWAPRLRRQLSALALRVHVPQDR